MKIRKKRENIEIYRKKKNKRKYEAKGMKEKKFCLI